MGRFQQLPLNQFWKHLITSVNRMLIVEENGKQWHTWWVSKSDIIYLTRHAISNHPSLTDWITAVGAIIASLGGVAGFVALALEIDRRKKKRFRPPSGLTERLIITNELLVEIINNNGQESLWFLTDEKRRNEGLLTALLGQIADEELKNLVQQILASYTECFARAPGHNQLRTTGNEKRLLGQTEAAQDAKEKCDLAILRVGKLLQLYPE